MTSLLYAHAIKVPQCKPTMLLIPHVHRMSNHHFLGIAQHRQHTHTQSILYSRFQLRVTYMYHSVAKSYNCQLHAKSQIMIHKQCIAASRSTSQFNMQYSTWLPSHEYSMLSTGVLFFIILKRRQTVSLRKQTHYFITIHDMNGQLYYLGNGSFFYVYQ